MARVTSHLNDEEHVRLKDIRNDLGNEKGPNDTMKPKSMYFTGCHRR